MNIIKDIKAFLKWRQEYKKQEELNSIKEAVKISKKNRQLESDKNFIGLTPPNLTPESLKQVLKNQRVIKTEEDKHLTVVNEI
tara:strand:- start:34 stop:282 length:249 start_codon:yes stop_codon:yes gene_type:complete